MLPAAQHLEIMKPHHGLCEKVPRQMVPSLQVYVVPSPTLLAKAMLVLYLRKLNPARFPFTALRCCRRLGSSRILCFADALSAASSVVIAGSRQNANIPRSTETLDPEVLRQSLLKIRVHSQHIGAPLLGDEMRPPAWV